MIRGVVTSDVQAVVRLRVQRPAGQEEEIHGVIDTGFNGSLTLPPGLIVTLGLDWRRRSRAILADGTESIFDTYEATVVWDGEPRRVPVDEANTDPLVGMTLMNGYELRIQVIDGGTVTLERLQQHL